MYCRMADMSHMIWTESVNPIGMNESGRGLTEDPNGHLDPSSGRQRNSLLLLSRPKQDAHTLQLRDLHRHLEDLDNRGHCNN
ncbi:hypothetical protein AB205_0117260, partial [Aquarana catesbeiana]